jgi:hypothetical protein
MLRGTTMDDLMILSTEVARAMAAGAPVVA